MWVLGCEEINKSLITRNAIRCTKYAIRNTNFNIFAQNRIAHMSLRDKYQPVIGLEVHCQLSTNTKAFVADSAEFGDMPNVNVSIITLAHPGALPKANKKAVEFSIKIGVACGSEISRYNEYARKNYFYPDLPKGYQITQDKHPICVGGTVKI